MPVLVTHEKPTCERMLHSRIMYAYVYNSITFCIISINYFHHIITSMYGNTRTRIVQTLSENVHIICTVPPCEKLTNKDITKDNC